MTSTTCPAASFNARGTWLFSGHNLVTDPCAFAETSTPQYTIDITTQCGDSVAGTIDVGSGASVTGHLTSSVGVGFKVDGSLPCNPNTGCCATIQFTANGINGNNANTADLQISSDCNGMPCPQEWTGTASR